MRRKTQQGIAVRWALAVAFVAWGAGGASAQAPAAGDWNDPASAIAVRIPPETALSIVSDDRSETEIYARGGAMVIDLRVRLELRNEGAKTIRGITLAAYAAQLTAGGRATVSLPSLNAAPGQTIPASVTLRLLRPLPGPPNPLVEITVDGVLMADRSFAGPDRLSSRRKMLAWELEADRDRRHFLAVLESGGPEALREEVIASLRRQAERPRLEARAAGAGAAVPDAARARELRLAALNLPAAPLEILGGAASSVAGTIESPRVSVRNRSRRPIRYFEIGWLVEDSSGRRYAAGALPSARGGPLTAPGATARVAPGRRFELIRAGETSLEPNGLAGYVRQVEFSDGSLWLPSREALAESGLLHSIPVSAEEQRLTETYRRKGLQAVVEELRALVR